MRRAAFPHPAPLCRQAEASRRERFVRLSDPPRLERYILHNAVVHTSYRIMDYRYKLLPICLLQDGKSCNGSLPGQSRPKRPARGQIGPHRLEHHHSANITPDPTAGRRWSSMLLFSTEVRTMAKRRTSSGPAVSATGNCTATLASRWARAYRLRHRATTFIATD